MTKYNSLSPVLVGYLFIAVAVIGDIFPKRMNPRAYASFRQKGDP